MDIDNLREKKKHLENRILVLTSIFVEEFKKETNFSPQSIDISMQEVTTMKDEEKQYVVGDCNIKIDL